MNDWPHAPVHRLKDSGTYFITAGTFHRKHVFLTPDARNALCENLFLEAKAHGCALQAWAFFTNHYHLVVAGDDVHKMLCAFHTKTARAINHRDGTPGRQVWFQFRDTQLTIEGSWLARLRYTHENAVHHGLVSAATQYPWCSAAWFASNARPSFVETVRRVKLDRVNVYDDYNVK